MKKTVGDLCSDGNPISGKRQHYQQADLTATQRVLSLVEDKTQQQNVKKNLDRLAWYLDSSIPLPGLNARFGIDSLIGLIPGIGDTLGAILSSYIIAQAAQLGAPKSVLLKMAVNTGLDSILGSVPIVGDLFDFVYKANQRNVQLLDSFLDKPQETTKTSRWFVILLVVAVLGFVVLCGALALVLAKALLSIISG